MNLSKRLWWGLNGAVCSAVLLTSSIAWFTAQSVLISDVDHELQNRATRTAQMPWIPMRFMRSRSRPSFEGYFLLIRGENGDELYKTESWPAELPSQLNQDDAVQEIACENGQYFRVLQIAIDSEALAKQQASWNASRHGNDKPKTPEAASPDTNSTAGKTQDNKETDLKSGETKTEAPREPDKTNHGYPQIGPGTKIVMAADITELKTNLHHLRSLLAIVGLGVLLAAVFIAGRLRDSLLAPVKKLGLAIDALPHNDIDARINLSHLPSELLQITGRLNDLLERLAHSRKRERRTIGDIAHELRTPLAALRTELEFAICAGDIPKNRSDFLQSQVHALHDRVNGLLLLMRLEAGQQELHIQELSVVELISDAWSHYQASGHQLQLHGDQATEISGDPTLLGMVIDNLIGNACAYSPAKSAIRIEIQAQAECCTMCISNPCALEPGNYEQAFDPFWRHDVSRQQTDAHHGLGLALVKRIAEAHQAQVSALVSGDQLFTLTLNWPRAVKA